MKKSKKGCGKKWCKQPSTRCNNVGLPVVPKVDLEACKKKCDETAWCGEIQVAAKQDTPGSKDVGCGLCIRNPKRVGAKDEKDGLNKIKWNELYKDSWGNMYIKMDTKDIKTNPKSQWW